MCVSSLIICCNPNWEVTATLICSHIVIATETQFGIKITKNDS